MSRQTRVCCDRCKSVIETGGSVLELVAGEARKTGESIDLCSGCGALLLDWIRSGHPDHAASVPPTYACAPNAYAPGVTATRTPQDATDDATGEWPVSTANGSPRAARAAGSGR